MIEYLENSAKEELKRADHLIYVTLKYTKTADVIKSIISRLISAFDFSITEALEYIKRKRKIKEVPHSSKIRAETFLKIFPKYKDYIEFYFLLTLIDKAEYTKKEEYRKNVALIVKIKGKIVEINMETLRRYFDKTTEFVNIISSQNFYK